MNKTFIRSLTAKDAEGNIESSFTAQPYCVGMYVAISIPGQSLVQLNLGHKQFANWAKGSIKKMEKNGLVVTKVENDYLDYMSKEEFETYVR